MDTKALRQKILDLAIRGKLVPQDSNDEPASVLLERIRQQKQQMVKEGKLKPKDIKNDSVIFVGEDNLHYEKFSDGSVKCIEDEIPFELPDGWAWARLSSIADMALGKMLDVAKNKGSLRPYLRNINVRWGTFDLSDTLEMRFEDNELERYSICYGDLVMCEGGEPGRCAVWKSEEVVFYQKALHRVRAIEILPEYLYYVIRRFIISNQYEKYYTGTTIKHLTGQSLRMLPIPLPPLNEQKLIVEHLQRIIEEIDKIEMRKTEAFSLVLLAKSKILDLAIRGKLVPQDSNDEPASVLLERIRAEKEELIRQGKIKRDKKESVIFRGEDNSYYVRQDTHTESIDEQFIFELPDNWEWCSLLNIAKIELGKTLDSAKNIGTNYPYLRSVNVRWNEVDLSDLKEMRFEPEELDRYTVRRNDLLICEGGDVGRSCVWTDEKEILYQNALHRVRFYGGCNPFYFMYYMMYYESRGIIKALCKGVTIKHLTGNVLSLIPFALPPIEEQGRIVERLNRIFVLLNSIICD